MSSGDAVAVATGGENRLAAEAVAILIPSGEIMLPTTAVPVNFTPVALVPVNVNAASWRTFSVVG